MKKTELYKVIISRLLVCIKGIVVTFLKTLPIAIVAGGIAWLLIMLYRKKTSLVMKKRVQNAIVLLAAYTASLVQMTIFSRGIGTVNKIDLIPFNTPGGFRYTVLYAIANALVFFPIGALPPIIWKKVQKMGDILFIGFAASMFIEIVQLIFQCGMCQTEDVIMNTIGAGAGYLIFKKWEAGGFIWLRKINCLILKYKYPR